MLPNPPGGWILDSNPLGVEIAPEGKVEDGGVLGLGAEAAGGSTSRLQKQGRPYAAARHLSGSGGQATEP